MDNLKQLLLDYLDFHGPKSARQLIDAIDSAPSEEELSSLLESMVSDGLLFKTKKDRYALPHTLGILKGRLQGNDIVALVAETDGLRQAAGSQQQHCNHRKRQSAQNQLLHDESSIVYVWETLF